MEKIIIGASTVLARAAEIGGWVELPASYDPARVTFADTQQDSAIRTLRLDEAERLERAIAAGEAWAERELDALPEGAEHGAWRGTAVDALPLVEVDDEEERPTLAEAANQAAASRWAELSESA